MVSVPRERRSGWDPVVVYVGMLLEQPNWTLAALPPITAKGIVCSSDQSRVDLEGGICCSPLAGAKVVLVNAEGVRMSAIADKSGTYAFESRVPLYGRESETLTVEAAGHEELVVRGRRLLDMRPKRGMALVLLRKISPAGHSQPGQTP